MEIFHAALLLHDPDAEVYFIYNELIRSSVRPRSIT